MFSAAYLRTIPQSRLTTTDGLRLSPNMLIGRLHPVVALWGDLFGKWNPVSFAYESPSIVQRKQEYLARWKSFVFPIRFASLFFDAMRFPSVPT